MTFKKNKDYSNTENTLIGAGWETDVNGVIFTGTLNITALKQLIKDHPDAVEEYKDSKQVRIFGFAPKSGKKGKGPDFYIKFSGVLASTKKDDEEEAPF